jgi:hypothetical protein
MKRSLGRRLRRAATALIVSSGLLLTALPASANNVQGPFFPDPSSGAVPDSVSTNYTATYYVHDSKGNIPFTGERVTVVVKLNSRDFNETGEKEPWDILIYGDDFAPGGIDETHWYYYLKPFNSTFYDDPKVGITQVVINSTPQLDGDERAPNVYYWVNLDPKRQKLIEKGQFLGALSSTANDFSTLGTGEAANFPGMTPALSAQFARLGSSLSVAAYAAGDLLMLGSADPNYMQLATSVIPRIDPVATTTPLALSVQATASPGLSAGTAAAFNALEDNTEQMIAAENALYLSLNRAAGADAAGNAYWSGQQNNAADGFVGQLAALCGSEITALTDLQNALKADGISFAAIPMMNAVYLFEIRLFDFASGFSAFPAWSPIVANLQTLGLDATEISDLTDHFMAEDFTTAAVAFPDSLTDPALIAGLKDFSTAFGNPFASFTAAQLEIASGTAGSFSFGPATVFALGSGAPALDLSTQAFSLSLGSVTINIPAGSFHQQKTGNWVFEGPVGSAAVQARISSPSSGTYELQLQVSGIDTSALTVNPVTVKLTLGTSFGSASANAEFTQ